MEYEINPKKITKLTALPQEIIEYISEVSGESLKVLLLIFSESCPLTSSEISSRLDLNLSQVEDAIRFWKFKEIIKSKEKKEESSKIKKPSYSQISSEELSNAKEKDKFVKMLFEESEKLFCRPLKPIERRVLLYIYDFYNMSVDVILMVIDFCVRFGMSLKKVTSICENFADNEIISHEQAEKQIQFLTEKLNTENQIRSCFGIFGRTLSANEKKLISKWTFSYGYKINMIKLAYNRCVDATGKLSFQYIDKILLNWKKNKIETPKDAEKSNSIKKSKKSSKTSYDLEELIAKSNILITE